jgi:hypothetical protein
VRAMRAKVCLYDGAELVCSPVVELEGLAKGGQEVYRAVFPSEVGVKVGWLVIVTKAYRVSSVTPTARGDSATLSRQD